MNQYFISIVFELFRSTYEESFEATSLDDAIVCAHELKREQMEEGDPVACMFLSEYNSHGVCTNVLSIRP